MYIGDLTKLREDATTTGLKKESARSPAPLLNNPELWLAELVTADPVLTRQGCESSSWACFSTCERDTRRPLAAGLCPLETGPGRAARRYIGGLQDQRTGALTGAGPGAATRRSVRPLLTPASRVFLASSERCRERGGSSAR